MESGGVASVGDVTKNRVEWEKEEAGKHAAATKPRRTQSDSETRQFKANVNVGCRNGAQGSFAKTQDRAAPLRQN